MQLSIKEALPEYPVPAWVLH